MTPKKLPRLSSVRSSLPGKRLENGDKIVVAPETNSLNVFTCVHYIGIEIYLGSKQLLQPKTEVALKKLQRADWTLVGATALLVSGLFVIVPRLVRLRAFSK